MKIKCCVTTKNATYTIAQKDIKSLVNMHMNSQAPCLLVQLLVKWSR